MTIRWIDDDETGLDFQWDGEGKVVRARCPWIRARYTGDALVDTAKIEQPFYVYIAGPLSGDPPEYLANVHMFCETSRKLIENGYVPINPAADMLEGLMSDEVLDIDAYKQRGLDLLRLLAGKRAALFAMELHHRDGSISHGTAAELREAHALGIPVVWTIQELDGLHGTSYR